MKERSQWPWAQPCHVRQRAESEASHGCVLRTKACTPAHVMLTSWRQITASWSRTWGVRGTAWAAARTSGADASAAARLGIQLGQNSLEASRRSQGGWVAVRESICGMFRFNLVQVE